MAKPDPTKALRRLHARGKDANTKAAKRKAKDDRTWGILESLRAKTPTAKNRLMEARKFARLYNDQQLDELCALGQKKGRPLTRFHVLQLIRVERRKDRNVLASKCAKESWSVRRLEMEVRPLVRRRMSSGRRHTPPKSVAEALIVTERLAAGWIRWVGVLEAGKNKASKNRITLGRLKLIRKELDAISVSADKLCKKIATKLKWQSTKPPKKSRRRSR